MRDFRSNSDASESILDQEIFTVGELAERLKISQAVVYRLLASGEISAYKVGRGWRIPKASVQRYLDMNTLLRQAERSDGRAE